MRYELYLTMKPILKNSSSLYLPNAVYLWTAIAIGAASGSVTRKIIEIGQQHFIDGRNPISLCNVLFVGNLCALILFLLLFYRDWNLKFLKSLTRNDWISLNVIAILAGAIAPALFFAALDNTTVTNVVLIGRLEPPLTLALSAWLLGVRVNIWTVAGSLVTFVGVAITAFLASSGQVVMGMGFLELGKGELQVAIAAIILAVATVITKLRLQQLPLGFFSSFRTAVGTVIFFVLAKYLYGAEHFAEALSPFLWGWMLIYAAIIVVVGQLFWFRALKRANPTEISLATSSYPILAILMAYVILGEIPTMAQYIGGIGILAGIILSFIGNLPRANFRIRPVPFNLGKILEMSGFFRGI